MREIAQGIWQLTGFPPNAVNIYLAGDVLIDTGTRWARALGTRAPLARDLWPGSPDSGAGT